MTDETVRGKVLRKAAMSEFTTWRVGGIVDELFVPRDRDDLAVYLAGLDRNTPVYWIGLGSNVLVRDGGLHGVVINTHPGLGRLSLLTEGLIEVESGAPLAKVARFAGEHRLQGAEFMGGIPGTVGGALKMNAGAFGGETWDLVQSVEIIDRSGIIGRRLKEEFSVAYRSVCQVFPGWFISARLQLHTGKGADSSERVRALIRKRNASQPIGTANAGSVFRNPPGDYAARLIESAGLKGQACGGAKVSDKHANFIVNTGSATASDIETLIELIRKAVKDQHGVDLLPEVEIVGERQ